MTFAPMFTLISRALVRHKLRSLLAMSSMTIGIAALMVLGSIGDSTKAETMKRFKNMLGTFDTIIVRPGNPKNRGMVSIADNESSLTFEDADAIADNPRIKAVARVQNAFNVDVKFRDQTAPAGIFGVTDNWLQLRSDEVASGQFLDENDVKEMARVAILGTDVVTSLFQDEDPLDKTIRIGDVPFKVKGVLKSRGAAPTGASLDNVILIPVTTASKRLFNRDFLTMVVAQLRNPDDSAAAIGEIGQLLRSRHNLTGATLDNISVTSPKAAMAQINMMSTAFEKMLSMIAVIGTVLGGTVIMIITLIGVSSRKSEIGLKRAVGASKRSILLQFLGEATLLSVSGGLLGIAVGIGITQVVSAMQHLPFMINVPSIVDSMVISTLIGLVFGVFPAMRAAKTDPIVALRA
jgi:putative ABC transport system permease protein